MFNFLFCFIGCFSFFVFDRVLFSKTGCFVFSFSFGIFGVLSGSNKT